jgi:CheY-like chemotaxis protein
MMLEKLGYFADIANNGIEIISMLKKQKYDLILTNIEMPLMDGIEAVKYIIEH